MKSLSEHINECLVSEAKIHFVNWNKYDISQEDLDMRCEELGLEYVIIPADEVNYSESVTDWLMEESGMVIKKPFNRYAKSLLKTFGIDPNKIEVFRHVASEALNFDEIVLYTPVGNSVEGEDYDFAVQELFPEEE